MTNDKEMVTVNKQDNIKELLERESAVAPLVDIFEDENEFVLVASMPGVSKENVQLRYSEESLMIFGRVKQNFTNRRYVLNENGFGNYYRRFRISDSIDESKIQAHFENGQLTVILPKHERVKPKTIEVR